MLIIIDKERPTVMVFQQHENPDIPPAWMHHVWPFNVWFNKGPYPETETRNFASLDAVLAKVTILGYSSR